MAKMTPAHFDKDLSEGSQAAWEDEVREPAYTDHPVTFTDLTTIAADIKSILSVAT